MSLEFIQSRSPLASHPFFDSFKVMPVTTELPTTAKLGIPTSEIKNIDHEQVARDWLNSFAAVVEKGDIDGVLSRLTDDAWWRDILTLTWDLRTFQGPEKIKQFLTDRLTRSKLSNFQLSFAKVDDLYEDLAWIRGHFTFDNNIGSGSGVFRLVPIDNENGQREWKAHNVFTNLESLRDFPEKSGWKRNFAPNHGKWIAQREQEMEFADRDPEVLVVGGGQSGLEIAARLKLLGVSTLVCEKQARVGDQWRHRYAALCLHDVVCKCHLII